jgi:hypothetical protein
MEQGQGMFQSKHRQAQDYIRCSHVYNMALVSAYVHYIKHKNIHKLISSHSSCMHTHKCECAIRYQVGHKIHRVDTPQCTYPKARVYLQCTHTENGMHFGTLTWTFTQMSKCIHKLDTHLLCTNTHPTETGAHINHSINMDTLKHIFTQKP